MFMRGIVPSAWCAVSHRASSFFAAVRTARVALAPPPIDYHPRPMTHHWQPRTQSRIATYARRLFIASIAGGFPVACQTPYGSSRDAILSEDALAARLDAAARTPAERKLTQTPATAGAVNGAPRGEGQEAQSAVEAMLAARRAELDAIGPQSASLGQTINGVVQLGNETPKRVTLTLQAAVECAVANNLDADIARLQQAIRADDLIRAEAAFDWVVGAGVGYDRVDRPSVGIILPGSGGATVIPNVTDQHDYNFGASIGQALTSGGAIKLAGRTDRIDNNKDGLYTPDPAWSSALELGLTQPLLRGFGEDVALSKVKLATNSSMQATEALRARLLSVVAQTEQAYWNLVSARARLVSAEWLVAVGEEVRDVLAKRREFDATLAQYANAVATVEQRKALVIEGRRRLSEAGSTLKALMNNHELPVGGEADVVPADAPSEAPFQSDLRASLTQAFAKNPHIAQAFIAIDSAEIDVVVADNGTLPQLDLATNVTWFGLEGDFSDSMSGLADGDFVNYAAGLQFSYALGNRAADAAYRQARLRRTQSFLAYEQAVQSTVLAVKNALTDCVSFRQLVEQNRTYRLAQAENLRALQVDEKTQAALTPEFLQLKFQLQNGLAAAEDAYFASLVGYQNAIAALQQATGAGLEAHRIVFDAGAATSKK